MSKGDDTKYKKGQKPAFTGIVKLASLLQKAVDSGRSNYVEMTEISRYMGYYVKTQIDDSSMYLDYILNNYKCVRNFKELRKTLIETFDDVNGTFVSGYEKLVAPNGSVNKNMLEELIQADTEICSVLNMIRSSLRNARISGDLLDEDMKELADMSEELSSNLAKRKKIVS